MSGLHPSLAGLVDTGKDGPKSYADVVGYAIRQEAWMKTEKKVIPNADEGSNETTQVNQRGGEKFGFNQKSLIIKTSQMGLVEDVRWVEKGRMTQRTKAK